MKLSQFKFKLPEELLAQYPSAYPEDARMLVLHQKTGEIEHKTVRDIVDYFGEGDLLFTTILKSFRLVFTDRKRRP